MKTTTGRGAAHGTFLIWFRRIAAALAIMLVLAVGLALLNNNVSILHPSRTQFVGTLDHALARSTDWALKQYLPTRSGTIPTPEGRSLVSNSALAHMVVDCASVSNEPGIKELGSSFVEAWRANPSVLGKMVDPAMPANPPSVQELRAFDEYQRWIMHGVAPNEVLLSPKELEDLFSPNKHRTGKATHQLFALYFYRRSRGSTPELDRLMNGLEQRIASEAAIDFRVTDLYLQRIAFLLAADRPDLVQPRWVERAFAAQQIDGGWLENWYGWTRTPFRFTFDDKSPNAHSTAQGMWIACMLKYRYPEWVDRNYK